jgi:hypothetical protein
MGSFITLVSFVPAVGVFAAVFVSGVLCWPSLSEDLACEDVRLGGGVACRGVLAGLMVVSAPSASASPASSCGL